MIELVIQNKKVSAKKGQTILQAARDAGVYIPTMCYLSKCDPIGACRLCVVEIDGQNGEIAACQAKALDGMVVTVNNERLQEYRKDIMKLFCVNHPRTYRPLSYNLFLPIIHFLFFQYQVYKIHYYLYFESLLLPFFLHKKFQI